MFHIEVEYLICLLPSLVTPMSLVIVTSETCLLFTLCWQSVISLEQHLDGEVDLEPSEPSSVSHPGP